MWKTTETEKKLFDTLNNINELIVFDVETTGRSPKKDKIIQISGIKYSINKKKENGFFEFKEIDKIDKYINPVIAINEEIENLTGITNEFIADQPFEEDVIEEIFAFFGDTPNVAAYNSNFDVRFLNELYARNGLVLKNAIFEDGKIKRLKNEIDVLKLARDLTDKKDTENFKLATIAKLYGYDDGISFHSAIEDVKVTEKLLEIFVYDYMTRNEESQKEAKEKELVKLRTVSLWDRYGHKMERIYINNEFYYSIYNKEWGAKKGIDIDEYDMEDLRKQVLSKYNVENEDDLVKVVRAEYKKKQKERE